MSKNVIGDLERGDMFICNGKLAMCETLGGNKYIRFCFEPLMMPVPENMSIQYIGVAKDFEHKLLTKIKKYDTI